MSLPFRLLVILFPKPLEPIRLRDCRIFVAALQHRDLRLRVLLVAQLNRRRDERGFHSSPYRSAAILLDVPVTSEAELDFLHATLPSTLLA